MSTIKYLSHTFIACMFLINTAYATDSIKIEDAWSPEAPPVVKVMAGYMKINNLSNKDIKILSVKSELFKHVDIHLTQMKDGMMHMIKQENLNIKANSHIELKPNALHMMLVGKLKPIKSGSVIPLTLSFDNGETVSIDLKVKSENRPQMKCGAGKCGSM